MDTRRLVVGTLVGGVAMFTLGWLVFELALGSFYDSQMTAAAAPAMRDTPLVWAAAVGALALGALVTVCLEWSGASSIAGGFKVAALVGFLAWGGVDFSLHSFLDLASLTQTVVDPFAEIVRTGLVGAVVAAALARVPAADNG